MAIRPRDLSKKNRSGINVQSEKSKEDRNGIA